MSIAVSDSNLILLDSEKAISCGLSELCVLFIGKPVDHVASGG